MPNIIGWTLVVIMYGSILAFSFLFLRGEAKRSGISVWKVLRECWEEIISVIKEGLKK